MDSIQWTAHLASAVLMELEVQSILRTDHQPLTALTFLPQTSSHKLPFSLWKPKMQFINNWY